MSVAVQLLEMLAASPASLTYDEFVRLVSDADLSPEVRDAMLRRDVDALSQAIGGRPTMFCAVFPAENEPEPDEQEPQEDDETPQDAASLAA